MNFMIFLKMHINKPSMIEKEKKKTVKLKLIHSF